MPGKRPRAKPDKLTYKHKTNNDAKQPDSADQPKANGPRKPPPVGRNVLVAVPEDEVEGLGGVQAQVARVHAVDQKKRTVKVRFYGWGGQYGAPYTDSGDDPREWEDVDAKRIVDWTSEQNQEDVKAPLQFCCQV